MSYYSGKLGCLSPESERPVIHEGDNTYSGKKLLTWQTLESLDIRYTVSSKNDEARMCPLRAEEGVLKLSMSKAGNTGLWVGWAGG
ncbi:MAG: hypothetical protein P4L43_10620, partial [Syntrophobacteraceae bacterium]|nr:hypothetical protein [Syntrophobacteraceae bacterium]